MKNRLRCGLVIPVIRIFAMFAHLCRGSTLLSTLLITREGSTRQTQRHGCVATHALLPKKINDSTLRAM